jgi:signal transduction histidine kinase
VRTVLGIHWGSDDFLATASVDAAIRASLGSDASRPIDYFAEHLEAERLRDKQASRVLADYIQAKYRDRPIDVVIAIADPALRFVLDHRADLFASVPVVYSGVVAPASGSRAAGGGVTGVLHGVTYDQTLGLALQLHPSTERVFVVARGPEGGTFESVQAELSEFSRRVTVTFINEPTALLLFDAIRAIPPRSVVLYIGHSQDDPGRAMGAVEIAPLVAQASPVPVYGTNDAYIGSGVVGGVVRDTRETASRLGQMAKQILEGTRARDIPIEDARLAPIFDWRAVQRWQIAPSRLPAGSTIRFRVPTVWETYRSYVVAIVIVIAAQLLLIAGLLTQRTRRRHAEENVRAREATLRTSYERIRQLAGRLINAQEAARADIARDLHDDVCQDLVGVSIAVSGLKRSSRHVQDPHTQEALSTLHRQTLNLVESVRRLSHDLHPATLRLVGLAAALETHCIEVEKRYDVQVGFRREGELTHLHPDVALCLFRIAQEALRNGVVHGDARRLAVSISAANDHVDMIVSDDGQGFDLEAARREGGGLGLISMEERVHAAGGELRILSRQQYGTTMRVSVPTGGRPAHAADDAHGHEHATLAATPRDAKEHA